MVLLGPLFFGAVLILPTLLTGRGGVKHMVVVDGTSSTFGALLTTRLDRESLFVGVGFPAGPRTIDSLTAAVDKKEIDGFLSVSDASVDLGRVTYRASNVSWFVTIGTPDHVITERVNATRLQREARKPSPLSKTRTPLRPD